MSVKSLGTLRARCGHGSHTHTHTHTHTYTHTHTRSLTHLPLAVIFRVFDENKDGLLSLAELQVLVDQVTYTAISLGYTSASLCAVSARVGEGLGGRAFLHVKGMGESRVWVDACVGRGVPGRQGCGWTRVWARGAGEARVWVL
jgi:hypothetical protein